MLESTSGEELVSSMVAELQKPVCVVEWVVRRQTKAELHGHCSCTGSYSAPPQGGSKTSFTIPDLGRRKTQQETDYNDGAAVSSSNKTNHKNTK